MVAKADKTYSIQLTDVAKSLLSDVRGKNKKTIADKIGALSKNPDQQGKQLKAELASYRSIPAGRYRIVYRIDEDNDRVIVGAIALRKQGSRSDPYALAVKLFRRGELG